MQSPRERFAALIALFALGFCGAAHADTACSQKSNSISLAVCFSVATSTEVGANVVIQAWVEARTGTQWARTSGNVAVREGSQVLVSGASSPGAPYSANYTFQSAVSHVLYARASSANDSPTISVAVTQHTPVFTNYTVLPAISRVGQSVRLKVDTDLYRPSGVLAFYVTPPGGTAATFTTKTISNPSFHIIDSSQVDFLFVTPYTASGNYQFFVKYLGDTLNSVFQSPSITVRVGPFPTVTTLSQTSTTSKSGVAFTLNAAITGAQSGIAAPAGNVGFYDGTLLLGTVALTAQGTAAFTTTNVRSTGAHSLTARYAGNADYQASSSSAVNHDITFDPTMLVPIIDLITSEKPPAP